VIHDPKAVVARVIRVIETSQIDTIGGQTIPMPVQSILVHSDTAGAVDLAGRLRNAIAERGATLTPLSRQG